MKKKKPDLNKIKEAFYYDEKEGILIRRFRELHNFKSCKAMKNANEKAGQIINKRNKEGYVEVSAPGYSGLAHIVIYALWYNRWPDGVIDHINHIRDDNRIENLREVSSQDNNKNKSKRIDNKSGVTGINYDNRRGLWVASISIGNRSKYLGSFAYKDNAIFARKEAEKLYCFHSNHGI